LQIGGGLEGTGIGQSIESEPLEKGKYRRAGEIWDLK